MACSICLRIGSGSTRSPIDVSLLRHNLLNKGVPRPRYLGLTRPPPSFGFNLGSVWRTATCTEYRVNYRFRRGCKKIGFVPIAACDATESGFSFLIRRRKMYARPQIGEDSPWIGGNFCPPGATAAAATAAAVIIPSARARATVRGLGKPILTHPDPEYRGAQTNASNSMWATGGDMKRVATGCRW